MAENKNSNRGVYNPNRFNYTDAKVSKKLKEKEEPDTGIFTHGEQIYNTVVSWIGFGCAVGLTGVNLVFAAMKLNFVASLSWSILSMIFILLCGASWALTCYASMKHHRAYSQRNPSKFWNFAHFALPYLDFALLMMMFFVLPLRYPVWEQMRYVGGGLVVPMLWYILFLVMIWGITIAGIAFHWLDIYGQKKEGGHNWNKIGKGWDVAFMLIGLWIPVCFYHILVRSFSMCGDGLSPIYLLISGAITMDIACIFKQRSLKKRYWIHAYEMTAYLAFAMEIVPFTTYTLWLWADKLL